MTQTCKQRLAGDEQCPEPAAFRFTWPGRDESYICVDHAPYLVNIADAIGLHLQLIPMTKPALGSES